MARYVDVERRKDFLAELERRKTEWDRLKPFIDKLIGKPSENVPLTKIRKLFESYPSTGSLVVGDIYSFLRQLHNMIMDLDLGVDENVTIPQALAAASQKIKKEA